MESAPGRRPISRTIFNIITILVLLGTGFLAGVVTSENEPLAPESAERATQDVPGFNVFWEAWDIVHEHYVDRSALDPTRQTYGAIEGMLESLGDDGHTRFLTPGELRAERQSLAGELEGIGAEVGIRNGLPTIVAPLPDSPAEAAGIRAGDTIVRVNDQDVAGLSLEEIVNLVRGPAGSPVTLTVIHSGETIPTVITITRAKINVPAVTGTILPGTQVAQIQLSQFSNDATEQLRTSIEQLTSDGATSLILDLRNNPGGLLDEAVGVTSQFIPEGTVLIQRDAEGEEKPIAVTGQGIAFEIPMVALINQGTASSGEIVAGALQDHERAQLVGETSFGTGTVLSQFTLSDGSAVLVGTTEWLTPDGHQIWHQGITPDIEVTLPPSSVGLNPTDAAQLNPDQLRASQDTQLLRALELLEQPNP